MWTIRICTLTIFLRNWMFTSSSVLACPEAMHRHSQPDQVGILHCRDPVHGTLVRLEDAGRAHRELRGAGHYRHQQEEDRLALLQQRSPCPARRHHQITGCESGLIFSFVFLHLLFTIRMNLMHSRVLEGILAEDCVCRTLRDWRESLVRCLSDGMLLWRKLDSVCRTTSNKKAM